MGIDLVWFLPIHPIGMTNRKGTFGSPYSIDDFRGVNPQYGTMDDFHRLVSEIHQLGMRLMIDIVFRHTSHDCTWVKDHPEWYARDEKGNPIALVPEWTDILDLKFEGNEETLWPELIDTLKFWCENGVDGFRTDVACCIPMEFWHRARRAVSEVNSRCIWLAESVWFTAIEGYRAIDGLVNTDAELYQTYDLCYDYDVYVAWRAAVQGAIPIKSYLELVRLQSVIYPKGFVKMRFVENHDQDRVAYVCRNNRFKALAWTAFNAFNKGCFLVHAGQETEQTKVSSLFEKDWVDCRQVHPLEEFTRKLIQIKKHPVIKAKGARLTLTHHSPCIVAVWEVTSAREGLIGLFNVAQESNDEQFVQISNLPAGNYENLFVDLGVNELLKDESRIISVNNNGKLRVPIVATIFHYTGILLRPQTFYTKSYNQPKISLNASWNLNATTFANEDLVGRQPVGIHINTDDSIYVADHQNGYILVWNNGSSTSTRDISGNLINPWSLFVMINGDIYVDNGHSNNRVDKWMFNTTNSEPVMTVHGSCTGLFVDNVNNTLYCSSASQHHVVKLELNNENRVPILVAGTGCPGPGHRVPPLLRLPAPSLRLLPSTPSLAP
ncbi:unnamed protein product, partial [Rotaria sp. Silwood1]